MIEPFISLANVMDGFYYVGIDNREAMRSVIRHLHQEETFDMSAEGYPNSLERVFSWRAGEDLQLERCSAGTKLRTEDYPENEDNYLFIPLHFMEYTAGYLVIWDAKDLMRIKSVSAIVNPLTMALRYFFSRQNLSYVNQVLSGISMKDELTGLYNRLGYHELAYPLFRRSRERGERLARPLLK